MIYKNCKCGVCGSDEVVITYVSELIEQIDIQPDGELIFACPPYEDNDLTINSLKEDIKNCGNLPDVDDDGYDVFFTCYNCEGEADSAVIEIDGTKYTDAEEAFKKIITKNLEL